MEEYFDGEIPAETDINDLLGFDGDWILSMLGIKTEEEEEMMINTEPKPCPFCGSTDIRSSLKTSGEKYIKDEKLHIYYATVFCNKCHTYGPRVRVLYPDARYNSRTTVERDEEIAKQAVDLWNHREEWTSAKLKCKYISLKKET